MPVSKFRPLNLATGAAIALCVVAITPAAHAWECSSLPNHTELKNALSQVQKLKVKMTPYSGLGMTAFYYTFSQDGITAQGLAGINGTKVYSAGVYTKVPAEPKLASLVRLAEKI